MVLGRDRGQGCGAREGRQGVGTRAARQLPLVDGRFCSFRYDGMALAPCPLRPLRTLRICRLKARW